MIYEDLNADAKLKFLRYLKIKVTGRALDHVSYTTINVLFIDKSILAKTGFYYLGPDLVKCYFCSVEVGMWQPNDNPVAELFLIFSIYNFF